MKNGQTHSIHYRPDIDGLRGLAILLVVIFHAFPNLIPGGFIGVDIFFVISGYLITNIILKQYNENNFSFISFYARRARRILPALIFVLISIWALGWLVLLANEFQALGKHISASMIFGNNFLLWSENGYFDKAAVLKPLLHLWSLGVEEQFYIFWPLVIFALHRWRLKQIGILGIVITSFIFNLLYIKHHAISDFYLLPGRLWEMGIGGFLACIYLKPKDDNIVLFWQKCLCNLAALLGLILIIFAAFKFSDKSLYPSWRATFPVIGAFLIIAASNTAYINKYLLSNRAALLLGWISYPLYLWHWPLLSLAQIMENQVPSSQIRCYAIGLAVILAFFTWCCVERPAQNMLAAKVNRALLIKRYSILLGGAVLVFVIGLITYMQNGLPFRHQVLEAKIQQMIWQPPTSAACKQLSFPTNDCYISPLEQKTIVILGDSHASALAVSGSNIFKQHGYGVKYVGNGGCPPLNDVRSYYKQQNSNCGKFHHEFEKVDEVVGDNKTVILASEGPIYFSGFEFAGNPMEQHLAPLKPNSVTTELSAADIFLEGYARTIKHLLANHKEVIFFIDNPELDFNPALCFDGRPVYLTKQSALPACSITTQRLMARQKKYREIIEELQHRFPDLKVFDPIPYLCNQDTCSAIKDNLVLYRDANHLSGDGVNYVLYKFFTWLPTAASDR